MAFVAWVANNVESEKLLPECDRTDETIRLRESDNNVNMCISILDIPRSAAIVRPDRAGQWRVLEEGSSRKWDSLCDYLILWESENKVFALFVELKGTSPHKKGKYQLLWSTPMLHYLWFVFHVDSSSAPSVPEPTFVSHYIEIGDRKNPRIPKSTLKPDSSPFFDHACLKGIRINYTTKACLSLSQLLDDRNQNPAD